MGALDLLQDGELCIVTTRTEEREATWCKEIGIFVVVGDAEFGSIRPDQVEEWRPASVKF